MKYHLSAIGGTFDKLHRGHREFLQFALDLSSKIILGLTSDTYIAKYKSGLGIEIYENRKQELEKYLESLGLSGRVKIIPLDDHAGPAVTAEYALDSLIVTQGTYKAAEGINKERIGLGLLPLPVEIFTLVLTKDGKTPISSTFIREKILKLPPSIRTLLKNPFGDVVDDIPNEIIPSKTITVGDATTKRFLDSDTKPLLVIIDNKIERVRINPYDFKDRKVIKIKNPASTITPELSHAVKDVISKMEDTVIEVDGEEDLAVLPVLIEAPVGFTVFYGQPHVGLVKVIITEEIKKKAQELLERFDIEQSV